ncbi:hypothetical protein SAMN04487969_116121 [Paenibacillus algorifonticola]|uniref:Alpha/beta hydrolase family protein n=1 Tax=Paenibacillus algorifonticola TaxID=684063 RepID=A0A1I2GKT8_9BACL|nr:alpha/beta hydrolase [Paenibacillus algorifonticola]SFF17600.1 hypothetical protein SAMN04487969_116121 [Paenibacillus algorifonticola]
MLRLIRYFLAGIGFPLSIYQKITEINDLKTIVMPGRQINVGGQTLHAHVVGQGQSTIVFDSGLGSFSLDWIHIQEQLKDQAVTVSYDRAGYGWSQKSKRNKWSGEIVEDLRQKTRIITYILRDLIL